MERIAVTAMTRAIGKGPARRARVAEAIPAVLYGKGHESKPVQITHDEMQKVLKTPSGLNTLIDLKVGEEKPIVVRIKECQTHPILHHFLHLDFQALDMKEKIVIEIPLHFEGQCIGVKDGGILEVSRRSLSIRCLPSNIPGSIIVDIGGLGMGESIHANDLTLAEGLEFPHAENFSIVQVVAPQKEVVAEVAADATVAAGDVPASETKEVAAPGEGEKKA